MKNKRKRKAISCKVNEKFLFKTLYSVIKIYMNYNLQNIYIITFLHDLRLADHHSSYTVFDTSEIKPLHNYIKPER